MKLLSGHCGTVRVTLSHDSCTYILPEVMAGEVNQNGEGNLVTLVEVDMSNYVHFWAYRCTTPLLRGENSTAKALLYQEHFPAYGSPDWLVHWTGIKAEMYICLVVTF